MNKSWAFGDLLSSLSAFNDINLNRYRQQKNQRNTGNPCYDGNNISTVANAVGSVHQHAPEEDASPYHVYNEIGDNINTTTSNGAASAEYGYTEPYSHRRGVKLFGTRNAATRMANDTSTIHKEEKAARNLREGKNKKETFSTLQQENSDRDGIVSGFVAVTAYPSFAALRAGDRERSKFNDKTAVAVVGTQGYGYTGYGIKNFKQSDDSDTPYVTSILV